MTQASAGSIRQHPSAPFEALGLARPLVRALADQGYAEPTPIQAEAIPHALAGRDVLGTAKTGTGKTAAFLLPLLSRLGKRPGRGIRILVVSPTRELAAQIGERAAAYGRHIGLRHTIVYGGVRQRSQERALRQDPSLLVATPGRLLDLVSQGIVRLDRVEMLVLDEADRMFDMGFLPDVRRIVAEVPRDRQTLLFSATMPRDIARLAGSILRDPVRVSVDPPERTPTIVEQSVYFVSRHEKRSMLLRFLRDGEMERALVFTRTKRGANRLAQQLDREGISSEAIHGNKSQNARDRALARFRSGRTPVLVATDVAARGIDVKGVSHVINYELPDTPESYVHRVGRTGRAGVEGRAISLCDPTERAKLFDIERLLTVHIPVGGEDGSRPTETTPRPVKSSPRRRRSYGGGRRSRGRRTRP